MSSRRTRACLYLVARGIDVSPRSAGIDGVPWALTAGEVQRLPFVTASQDSPGDCGFWSHFTDEEIEAQRRKVTCLRSRLGSGGVRTQAQTQVCQALGSFINVDATFGDGHPVSYLGVLCSGRPHTAFGSPVPLLPSFSPSPSPSFHFLPPSNCHPLSFSSQNVSPREAVKCG